jgi:hypothetical protein
VKLLIALLGTVALTLFVASLAQAIPFTTENGYTFDVPDGTPYPNKWVDQIKHKIGLLEIPFWRGFWLKRYYLYFGLSTYRSFITLGGRKQQLLFECRSWNGTFKLIHKRY